MTNFLVSGLINIETTLQVDAFPVEYSPVEYPFFSMDAAVSGAGYNITKALTRLGNRVNLLSIIGGGLAANAVRFDMGNEFINEEFVLGSAAQTARSIIIHDREGRRKTLVDLKDIQDQNYPQSLVEKLLPSSDIAVLCNINFSRRMLPLAKRSGKLIATNVHTISELEPDYNLDFMEAADILFMSEELLPIPAEEWAHEIMGRYQPEILVIGLGKEGALLAVGADGFQGVFPKVETRPIVNTIGAGEALFSAFLHDYVINLDPYEAIKKALVFASYKIGGRSASAGFISSNRLNEIYRQTLSKTT